MSKWRHSWDASSSLRAEEPAADARAGARGADASRELQEGHDIAPSAGCVVGLLKRVHKPTGEKAAPAASSAASSCSKPLLARRKRGRNTRT
eukprot:CAMPEP_0118878336 /NCGR_PEP_ID=MMETSP1163-20130328/18273_1 /TAXON_ID=124430 /ORGANISM="Phaeomonas parva, Strain CCMP2877" /LENGTH=91 /DNA_ID=CAMNT_0006814145 /DNA_START=230 /DNA_END=505 /DNA_ORIENTATION=+